MFSSQLNSNEIVENFTLNIINFLNNLNYFIYLINYNIILFTSCFIFSYFFVKSISARVFLSGVVNLIFFYLILNQFSLFEIFNINIYIASFFVMGINLTLFIINLKYSKIAFSIKDYIVKDSFILFKGNNKNKIISMLEIEEIPKNLKVRETREIPTTIEKLNIKYTKQYVFYHLLTIAEELEQLAYEIVITDNSIKLRFIITIIDKKSIDSLITIMNDKIDFFESVYTSCFSGLKFKRLHDKDLMDAWKQIINFSDKKIKILNKSIIKTSETLKKSDHFLSILKFETPIFIKPQETLTQIDQLINNMLSNKINSHFTVVIKPYMKHDFNQRYNKFGPNILNSNSFFNKSDDNLRYKVKKCHNIYAIKNFYNYGSVQSIKQ